LSFFFFSAPFTELAMDLSLRGLFFPVVAPLPTASLAALLELPEGQLSDDTVLELVVVVVDDDDDDDDEGNPADEEANDLGGLAWISVIIRAWLE
jgi:hypothetical protein